ncbi:MAG: VWA domain-containing protein [Pseudonocardiaceae bacterium]
MARLIVPSSLGWCSRLLASLTLVVVTMSTTVASAAGVGVQPGDPGQPELPPIDIVVLVDESGSLSEADVAREKEAARSIALSALSPASTIAVVGFGSSEADGQSAVDVVCPPTVLDTAQNLDAVTVCINKLHQRTPQEGDNTDHLAALKQARSYLDNGSRRAKIVFLLTDGELRVPNTDAYGRDAEDRNAFALKQIEDEEKPRLVAAGAQVWPLGFGKANLDELAKFAAGRSCDPKLPAPAAQVRDPAQLSSSILTALSSAACVRVDPPSKDIVGKGKAVVLKVNILPIASASAIIVNKRDSRIGVTYLDPQNRNPFTDPDPESTFQFSGQGTETEALRIGDPEPGTWTVRLTSHGDVDPQEVAATLVYQSAVSAALAITPPQPTAGQDVEVDMQIRARKQGITDPAVLAGLTFTADLTAGGRTSAPVALTDPDEDGTFSGRLAVPPDAAGNLRITGRVSGLGIGGDERTSSARVGPGTDQLQAQILLTGDGRIGRSGSVSGQVTVTNRSGQPRRLRLVIDQPSPGAEIAVDPAILDVPASGSAPRPFTLHFGAGTVFGPNQAALQVVDDTDPAQLVAQRLFTVDVEPPPSWPLRFWWVLVLIAVALGIGVTALLVARRSWSQRVAVRGLKVELHRDGLAISELEPVDSDAHVLRFSVYDDRITTPRLSPAPIGDAAAYALRRSGDGLLLETPTSGPQHIRPGEPVPDAASERTLVIRDERAPAARAPATPPFASSSAGGPQPPPRPYPGTTAGPPGPFAGGPPSPFGGAAAGPPVPGHGPAYP